MKKYLFSMLLIVMISSVFAGHGPKHKHYYVKVKPDNPKVVIVNSPGPKYVYQHGYWVWRPALSHYEFVEGAWVLPPAQYKVWVPGHWRKTRLGWYWVDGHWQ